MYVKNSKGSSDSQKSLAFYCDDSSDVLVMSFVLDFSDGSLPMLNLANGCNGPAFSGTELLECSSVAAGKCIKFVNKTETQTNI